MPGENKCIHPTGGSAQPSEGTSLSIALCPNEDRCKWKFYDDRGKFLRELHPIPLCCSSLFSVQQQKIRKENITFINSLKHDYF